MSEGYISIIYDGSNAEAHESINRFVSKNAIDNVSSKDINGTSLIEINGETFESSIEDEVDEALENGSIKAKEYLRIVHNDEYGCETFWILNDGELSKYDHYEDDDPEDVATAYKEFHVGLEGIHKGVFEKSDFKIEEKKKNNFSSKDIEGRWMVTKLKGEDFRNKELVWEFARGQITITQKNLKGKPFDYKIRGNVIKAEGMFVEVLEFDKNIMETDTMGNFYTFERI